MKKRITAFALAIVLSASLTMGAHTGKLSLDNFSVTQKYSAGQFTDVAPSAWYADYVAMAYEYGLVKGSSSTAFNPNGNITLAEVTALACRIHRIYCGGDGAFEQGNPWYKVYVDYALAAGLLSEGRYSERDYVRPAARWECAEILYGAVMGNVEPINAARTIPDVSQDAVYAKKVHALYAAGILTGGNAAGRFYPDRNITRAEISTIIVRMVNADMRVTTQSQAEKTAATLFDCKYSSLFNTSDGEYGASLKTNSSSDIGNISWNSHEGNYDWSYSLENDGIHMNPNLSGEQIAGNHAFFAFSPTGCPTPVLGAGEAKYTYDVTGDYIWIYSHDVVFSLDGRYQTLVFDMGPMARCGNGTVTIKILLDGSTEKTIAVKPDTAAKHYSLDVRGINTITFRQEYPVDFSDVSSFFNQATPVIICNMELQ